MSRIAFLIPYLREFLDYAFQVWKMVLGKPHVLSTVILNHFTPIVHVSASRMLYSEVLAPNKEGGNGVAEVRRGHLLELF